MEAVKVVIASFFCAKTQYCTDFPHDLKFLPGNVSHKMTVMDRMNIPAFPWQEDALSGTVTINTRLMDKEFKS